MRGKKPAFPDFKGFSRNALKQRAHPGRAPHPGRARASSARLQSSPVLPLQKLSL